MRIFSTPLLYLGILFHRSETIQSWVIDTAIAARKFELRFERRKLTRQHIAYEARLKAARAFFEKRETPIFSFKSGFMSNFTPIDIDDDILQDKTKKAILEYAIYSDDDREADAAKKAWVRLFPDEAIPENPEWSVQSAREKQELRARAN